MTDRPRIEPELIPEALKAHSQWVGWAYSEVRSNGKQAKPPVDIQGRKIDPTNPANWLDLDEALAAYEEEGSSFDGIGFVLSASDPFVCIDLDDCIDEAGRPTREAAEILREFNTYTERSPSGKGFHVWMRAGLAKSFRKGPVEVYSADRYITMTGQRHSRATTIKPRQRELDRLVARLGADKGAQNVSPPALSGSHGGIVLDNGHLTAADEALIERIRVGKQGAKFDALMQGDLSAFGGDQSAADLGLASILAWHCKGDTAQMSRIFDVSQLAARAKWQDRPDYQQRTIFQALQNQQTFNSQDFTTGVDHPPGTHPVVACGDGEAATPQPLPELPAVEQFDSRMLPDAFRPFIDDISERMQCPPDYAAAGLMVALSAVVGRKVGIRPQHKTDWTETANLWGMVIGRPGMLKSPSLETALGPLKRLVAKESDAYQDALEQFRHDEIASKLRHDSLVKRARKELDKNPSSGLEELFAFEQPEPPVMRRLIANDTTPASLGELLRQNPNGLLVYRDEIVGLLTSMDREDQAEGRSFYLTGWSGNSPYTFDRIGRGMNLHIPAVCIALLGGTQPGKIAPYIRQAVKGGAGDDGLIQRFGLMVWPDMPATPWKDVDHYPDTNAKQVVNAVFDRIHFLTPEAIGAEQDETVAPYLRFSPDALAAFKDWRGELEILLRSESLHPALESHLAKYRKLIPALALNIHLADGGTGEVGLNSLLKALAWGEYLKSHAHRAYSVATQPEMDAAKTILRRIKRGDLGSEFTSKEVWRPCWAGLADREVVRTALQTLVDYDHLLYREEQTGGRPRGIYQVVEVAA